ncbi:MAG: hypothetical protein M1820_000821 [Bogoriella megaspora]|nr:MAG: hypothetical protein M1820_000821 [Bogoriella megaspora]
MSSRRAPAGPAQTPRRSERISALNSAPQSITSSQAPAPATAIPASRGGRGGRAGRAVRSTNLSGALPGIDAIQSHAYGARPKTQLPKLNQQLHSGNADFANVLSTAMQNVAQEESQENNQASGLGDTAGNDDGGPIEPTAGPSQPTAVPERSYNREGGADMSRQALPPDSVMISLTGRRAMTPANRAPTPQGSALESIPALAPTQAPVKFLVQPPVPAPITVAGDNDDNDDNDNEEPIGFLSQYRQLIQCTCIILVVLAWTLAVYELGAGFSVMRSATGGLANDHLPIMSNSDIIYYIKQEVSAQTFNIRGEVALTNLTTQKGIRKMHKDLSKKKLQLGRDEIIKIIESEIHLRAKVPDLKPLSHEEVMEMIENTKEKPLSKATIQEMINDAIFLAKQDYYRYKRMSSHSKDKVAPVLRDINFLSATSGAVIDPNLTSPTIQWTAPWISKLYRKFWLPHVPHPPVAALVRWEEPSDAWCSAPDVKGMAPEKIRNFRDDHSFAKAQLAVNLPYEMIPYRLIIEHMNPDGSFDIKSAPEWIELWMERNDVETRKTLADEIDLHHGTEWGDPSSGQGMWPTATKWSIRRGLANFGLASYESPDDLRINGNRWTPPERFVRIGKFHYDIENPNNIQDFKVHMRDYWMPSTKKVIVRVVSNHGREWTCLYRVKLEGTLAEDVTVPRSTKAS